MPHDADELLWVTLAMVPVVVLEELLFLQPVAGRVDAAARTVAAQWWGGHFVRRCTVPRVRGACWGRAWPAWSSACSFFQAGSIVLPAVAHYVTNMLQIGFVRWAGVPETDG
ncbi:MAG: hypothetical protein R3A10_16205 [Caldilineaceae bacterium]